MVSPVQAPCPSETVPGTVRRLAVGWQNPVTGGAITPIGILWRTQQGYEFAYLRRAQEVPGFQPLLGLADFTHRYRSPALFPVFRQRLMDHRRPDYRRYLQVLGLPEGVEELKELGRSEGRRAGDSIFMFPEPHIDARGRTATDFFVHGLRYKPGAQERVTHLQPGELLLLREEPSNPVNERALLVTHDGAELGYVPDILVEYVRTARERSPLTVRVVQVNGIDTPPNLRLLAHLEGSVPPEYRPFSGEGWELAR